MLPPVFPSTALRTRQAEVKRAADAQEVLITDNGSQNYAFASERVLADTLNDAEWDADFTEHVAERIRRGMEEIERGEYIVGADAAIAEIRRRRAARG